jgi:hypothetical protein
MCFMNSPTPPPPPPPPPAAPPVLEQEAPKLSGSGGDGNILSRRSRGMKSYKISKRNSYTSDTNKLGGMVQKQNTNV